MTAKPVPPAESAPRYKQVGRCVMPVECAPADDLCARLRDAAYDDTAPHSPLLREAAARIAALEKQQRDHWRACTESEYVRITDARIAALETDVKRARNNAEWLYEQTSNLDTRAEAAEARVRELEGLLRESQASIGGDWRERRDAAIDAAKAKP